MPEAETVVDGFVTLVPNAIQFEDPATRHDLQSTEARLLAAIEMPNGSRLLSWPLSPKSTG
jgi:hypothetical protein